MWLQQIGFFKYCESFWEQQVDGDLFLWFMEEEFQIDLGMKLGIICKRFFREFMEFKIFVNYFMCDCSNLVDWLGSLDLCFCQYIYGLVSCGLDCFLLYCVFEQQLLEDCGIYLGVYCVCIFMVVREMLYFLLFCIGGKFSGDILDVFISYCWNLGFQLVSFLKVYLQLYGFSVFIDVEKLEVGKFEDKFIQSVMGVCNFVLVLLFGVLDKCM